MEKKIKNIIGLSLILISIIYIVQAVVIARGGDLWYDESFSMAFINGDFMSIAKLTALDVHPPFYYWYLKVVVAIGKALFGGANAIYLAKIASVIPYFGILLLSLCVIRRYYDLLAAGFFMLLITIMPQVATYYTEIRMYSLAMFLVFAAFGAFISIVHKKETKGGARGYIPYAVFFICGILTAYTQYFACVAIIALYLMLLIYSVLEYKKGMREALFKTIICIVLSIICYVPWLPKVLNQMGAVTTSYWIQPMSIKSFLGCIKYIYLPVSGDGLVNYVAAGLMIAATAAIFVMFIKVKPEREELLIASSGVVVPLFIVVVGFVFSILGHPIFVYRYMIPALGVYFGGLSIMMAKVIESSNIWFVLVIVPFLFGGYHQHNGYYYEELNKLNHVDEALGAISAIPDDAIIITNFNQVCTLMYYYKSDNEIYLYEGYTDDIVKNTFDRWQEFLSEKDAPVLIKNALKDKREVYFIGSFNSRDDIIKEWESNKISSKELSSVLLERYWFNVYKLTNNE